MPITVVVSEAGCIRLDVTSATLPGIVVSLGTILNYELPPVLNAAGTWELILT